MRSRIATFLFVTACFAVLWLQAAPPGYSKKFPAEAVEGEKKDTNNYRKLIVQFRSGTPLAKKEAVLSPLARKVRHYQRVARNPGHLRAAGQKLLPQMPDGLAVVTLADGMTFAEAKARLKRMPEVLFVEPDYKVKLHEIAGQVPVENIPDDFDFRNSWGLENLGQTQGHEHSDIAAPWAWGLSTGDTNVIVAVIDTGIDYLHPDLAANVWRNGREIPGNGIDDDGNGFVDDLHGYDFVTHDGDPLDDSNHGTHVAGVIGAVGNNKIGIAGICWNANLMAVKAFDEHGEADTSTVIDAIHYAIQNGADVINASWGQAEKSQALELAVNEAHDAGVLFIAAAGNDRTDVPSYPAACEHVIAVAATDHLDQRAGFSNYGPYVDLSAPGVNIYSTYPNNSYEYLNGTSMATPHVAGVAALILSLHPNFTTDEIENILRNTTDEIITDRFTGTGRLNAYRAVQITEPLPTARIDAAKTVFGPMDVRGSAFGASFESYRVEYGRGANPTNWTVAVSSASPSTNGVVLAGFDSTLLEEDDYTFRLVAFNRNGQYSTARSIVSIRNVQIAEPLSGDIARAGERLEILGTVWGRGRTYKLFHGAGLNPTEWLDTGVEIPGGGTAQVINGRLALWDTSQVLPNDFYTLKLVASSPGHADEEFRSHYIFLDSRLKPGWPVNVPIVGDFPIEDWRQVTVADLEQDGKMEVVLVDHANSEGAPAHLMVYNHDGSLRWSRELGSGPSLSDIPVVGDLDGDGKSEVLADIGSKIFAFHSDGSPVAGAWPLTVADGNLGKTLADLDHDGRLELVAVSQGGSTTRHVYVIDVAGQILRHWSVVACETGIDAPKVFPAVANLDDDKDLEIVTFYGCQQVACFDLKNTNGPVWSASLAGYAISSPVIGDLNHDGRNEIVLACARKDNSTGGLYVFDQKGHLWPGFPILNDESFVSSPALADVDGSGKLHICVSSISSGSLHLIGPTGLEREGWPVKGSVATANSGAVFADVDGNGIPEIVFATPAHSFLGVPFTDYSLFDGIRAWDASGKAVTFHPDTKFPALLMEGSGGTWEKTSPATLADLDGDGFLDVVATSIHNRTVVPFGVKAVRKNRSTIYAWGLNATNHPTALPWPAFLQNSRHTGAVPPPIHINEAPILREIPDQIIAPGGSFFAVVLNQFGSDPDHEFPELTFSVSGNQNLSVVNSNGTLFVTSPNPAWRGDEVLTMTVRDPVGLAAIQRPRFSVRDGYVPPLLRDDVASTLEDTSIEVDVLSNDEQLPGKTFTILNVSKPPAGRVSITPAGKLLFQPNTNFTGAALFNYTVGDGQGGLAMATVTVHVQPVNDAPLALPLGVIASEDVAATIDILAICADPDGDNLAIASFTQPENGTLSLVGTNLLYTAKLNYNGNDLFSYTITDPAGLRGSNTVTVLIKPVNDVPVTQDQSFTLNKNASANISFLADDPEKDELTFRVIKGPDHGELYAFPKIATYYPTNAFTGEDSFTYVANDGKEDGMPATVKLRVLDVNNLPVADSKDVTTKTGQSLLFTLTGKDLDKDPLTFSIVKVPGHGTVTLENDKVLFQPEPGYIGQDRFQFQVSDVKSSSASATVSITITDQNSAPEARDSIARVRLNTATNIVLDVGDAEGNPLTYTIVTNPIHGAISGPLTNLIFTPEGNYVGSDRFTFKVSDGELESKPATVTVAIRFPNNPPVALDQYITIRSNETATISLQVTDPEGDAMVCPILKGPKSGLAWGSGTNFVYRPRAGFLGADSFTYKAWDGRVYGNEGRVTVNVIPAASSSNPRFVTLEPQSNGDVRLSIATQAGRQLKVYSSTNLLDWAEILNERANLNTLSLTDTNAISGTSRFYKAVSN